MNEYMIRFIDGTIKHIKADSCTFMCMPGGVTSSSKPMAVFYVNHKIYYTITLDSISAIRFPVDGDKNDKLDASDGNT